MRLALGIAYRGGAYRGWQSQAGGATVQDQVEAALSRFADARVRIPIEPRVDSLNVVVAAAIALAALWRISSGGATNASPS